MKIPPEIIYELRASLSRYEERIPSSIRRRVLGIVYEFGDKELSLQELQVFKKEVQRLNDFIPLHPKIIKVIENLDKNSNEENIKLINKIISDKIKVKKEKVNIVFFFGSGASKPLPSNIPVVAEMLDYLVDKLPPTEMPFTNKMKEWSLGKLNIEDILTAGYLSSLLISKPSVNKLIREIIYREENPEYELRETDYVHSFQDLSNRVFSMISGMMANADSNSVHDKISSFISKNKKLGKFSIVTTNYDICLEKALDKIGESYSYLGIDEKIDGLPIIKIHGSINWFYCEGCQSVITYSIKEIKQFSKIYPTNGSCQKCGTSASLFMVPPIAYKYVMFPPLIDIWQSAMNNLENADIIISIGYSFSLSDDYILKMIISGMKKQDTKLIVLNRSDKAITNLELKLKSYHLERPVFLIDDASISIDTIINLLQEHFTPSGKK